jgi:hypothetical protein
MPETKVLSAEITIAAWLAVANVIFSVELVAVSFTLLLIVKVLDSVMFVVIWRMSPADAAARLLTRSVWLAQEYVVPEYVGNDRVEGVVVHGPVKLYKS